MVPEKKINLMYLIFNMPWKVRNEIMRMLSYPFVRFQFELSGIEWKKGWLLYGIPILQICKKSKVTIGNNLVLRSTYKSNPLSPNHPVVISTRQKNAFIHIGDDFGMTGGSLISDCEITIGNRVTIGANCDILDTDFHPLSSVKRASKLENGNCSPVHIHDDVFIGTGSIILKGVTIGKESVIGAGSVVTKNIPQNVLAAGNPAKVIKQLF